MLFCSRVKSKYYVSLFILLSRVAYIDRAGFLQYRVVYGNYVAVLPPRRFLSLSFLASCCNVGTFKLRFYSLCACIMLSFNRCMCCMV